MRSGTWSVDRIVRDEGKASTLPYLITIESDSGDAFQLRSAAPWPPTAGNSYAMRSQALLEGERAERLEQCRIVDVHTNRGTKAQTISVVLDRKSRKRCSFLVTRNNGREHIFFRTQAGIEAHKSHTYLQPTSLRVINEVVIDTREKHAWKLAAEKVTRAPLPAGDYALRVQERIVAVVERKTLPYLHSAASNKHGCNGGAQ